MLLNSDIQIFLCLNDFTLSKEINVIMYIIEFQKKIKSNHFIWIKFQ